MSTLGPRYDKELQQFLDNHPESERRSIRPQDIGPRREALTSGGEAGLRARQGIDLTEWTTEARDGYALAMTTIQKMSSPAPRAALFHIHGGGMISGDRFVGMDLMADWVEKHDFACATVEYRLSPEHAFPIPLQDCFDGLLAFSKTLPNEIPLIVAGMSAGGGLSAAVAQMAKDAGAPTLAGQLLMCPMLDCRNDSTSSLQFQDLGLWDRQSNDTGWDAYLGERRTSGETLRYASPLHHTDLTQLPPTFLDVGTLEVFRSEIVSYAERLAAADVPVEFHLWMGAFHGFDLNVPHAQVSREAMQAREQWLLRLLKGHVS